MNVVKGEFIFFILFSYGFFVYGMFLFIIKMEFWF